MDDKTIAVLALQLAALFSVACAMVLYLLCKIRPRPGEQACIDNMPGAGKAVLVTSCENSLGLQVTNLYDTLLSGYGSCNVLRNTYCIRVAQQENPNQPFLDCR